MTIKRVGLIGVGLMGHGIGKNIVSKGFAIETPEFATIGKMIAQLHFSTLVVQEGGYPSPSLGLNLASLLNGLAA